MAWCSRFINNFAGHFMVRAQGGVENLQVLAAIQNGVNLVMGSRGA